MYPRMATFLPGGEAIGLGEAGMPSADRVSVGPEVGVQTTAIGCPPVAN